MASINTRIKTPPPRTHEGAVAVRISAEDALRRSVMSCLLWEDEFYESGLKIGDRIYALAMEVPPSTLAAIAIEAREVAKLRHVPLLLLVALCKSGSGTALVGDTIARVISRADELAELLALYWKRNGTNAPLSKQLKLGLARAFEKFDAYQIAKYDREGAVRLRDVLFLTHAKPGSAERKAIYDGLTNKTLTSPDTWEVALSAGADKRETFERLLRANKLGYLALLRNLRNMDEAGVERALVIDALKARRGADRVLPFRYVAAARHAPAFAQAIDEALVASIADMEKLPGTTVILVDVSGSMDAKLSGKSDLTRMDAAATLAAVAPCQDLRVFSFSHRVAEVPPYRGMAGVTAVIKSQPHGGTYLAQALTALNEKVKYDRLIVITDEQAAPGLIPAPKGKGYMINVASARNGIGYGAWTHIDGFSENVLRFIREFEAG